MIDPPPVLSISGIAARMPRHTPMRLTSSTRRNSSSLISSAVPGIATPTLLNITSRRRHPSTASRTRASTSDIFVTSARTNIASPPASRISCAALSPRSSATSPITTRAPSTARAFADARPMPFAPPVTIATFPSSRPISPPLRAPELRLAFVDERVDSLSCVAARPQARERRLLHRQPFLKLRIARHLDQAKHLGRRERCDLRHRLGLRQRRLHQPLGLDDLRDEAEAERVVRAQPPGRQQHVRSNEPSGGTRQSLRSAAAGRETQQAFGESEPGVRARDQHVAAQCDLEPTAERVAVHRAHHRLGEPVDPREQPPAVSLVPAERLLVLFGVLADVGAGHERLLAGSGQDHDPHVDIALGLVETPFELVQHGRAERVQLVRPAERQNDGWTASLGQNERHDPISPSSRSARISASENPASLRTSSVCAPTAGGPERISPGVSENRMGTPTTRRSPPDGCRTVSSSRLCSTCGSSTRSSNV